MPGRRPYRAAMLFSAEIDPYWEDEWSSLGDFYNEILHQDTCQPATADGLTLLAALALDDRVPVRHRFEIRKILFAAATVAERPCRRLAGDPATRRSGQRGPGSQHGPGPHSRTTDPLVGRIPRGSAGPRRPCRRLTDIPPPARPDTVPADLPAPAPPRHRYRRLRAFRPCAGHPGRGPNSRSHRGTHRRLLDRDRTWSVNTCTSPPPPRPDADQMGTSLTRPHAGQTSRCPQQSSPCHREKTPHR